MIDREQAIQAAQATVENLIQRQIYGTQGLPEVVDAILALPDPGPKLSTGYVEDIAWADEMQAEIARLRRVVAAARELAESRWVDCGDPQRLFDFRALRSALAALDGER